MENMVSMNDYADLMGGAIAGGAASPEQVDQLNKALSAGTARGGNVGSFNAGDGSSLRMESLEETLKVITYREEMIKLWRRVKKKAAYNTVEEYNLLREYGGEAGVFTTEGELPETVDSTLERKTALVKFLGVVGEVTHPMMLVRSAHGNVVALEIQNKTRHLLRQIEIALFNGNSDNISVEWDGYFTQILKGVGINNLSTDLYSATDIIGGDVYAKTVVIDCRGGKIDEEKIEAAANFGLQNYAQLNTIWMAPQAKSDLVKEFYPRQRINLPPPVNGRVGMSVSEVETSAGLLGLEADIFLRSGAKHGVKTPPVAATSAKAPSAPSASAGTPGSDSKSMFKAADVGDYQYKITAVNRYGESLPSAATTAKTLGVGQSVTVTITPVVESASAQQATCFKVYRKVGSGEFIFLTTVKAGSGSNAFSWQDYNWFLPGCSMAWMSEEDDAEHHSFRQLAPLMRIPLATLAASMRWMQLLYGTPLLYKPRQNVLFINVKDS